ncbi:Kelch domain-containing protein 10 [Sarcoptes scabiei]|uniref:Kelch domain-containing protein 10 n=1 Tax=Sarcoptes scabiei TaxID=52283 RepID=A0A834RDY4_SARSC|nr:Kelch domain-containing protein 10 [Sarcoptes scabiei]UXI15254.1 ribosomal protein [Sarcoptes scabiei]
MISPRNLGKFFLSNNSDSNQHNLFRLKSCKFETINQNGNDLWPYSRSGHRIVSDENYVYLFGGYNPQVSSRASLPDRAQWERTNPLFKELWRYSKLTRSWQYLETTGDIPSELASHCAVMIDANQLLVYGGSGIPFGYVNSNKMYICNLENLSWSRVSYTNELSNPNNITENSENNDVPEAGYGQALVYDSTNELIYVCGGTTGFHYSLNIHEFNLKTKRWQLLSSTHENIEPRYRHEMVLYRNKLFIFAGGTFNDSFLLEKIPVFDLRSRKWEIKITEPWDSEYGPKIYPSPRYSHGCVQRNNLVYILGGANQNQMFKDTWSLNLDTLKWFNHIGISLPTPCYFHSTTIHHNGFELYVFGGINCMQPQKRSNTLYRCWLGVPTLQRMAMEAIKKYLEYSKGSNSRITLKNICNYLNSMGINHEAMLLPEF